METETKRTKKVLLVYTGGTIGMDKNPKTGALEPLNFSHLLEKIPEYDQLPPCSLTRHSTPPTCRRSTGCAWWT